MIGTMMMKRKGSNVSNAALTRNTRKIYTNISDKPIKNLQENLMKRIIAVCVIPTLNTRKV